MVLRTLSLILLSVGALAAFAARPSEAVTTTCSKYASPKGSDSWPGTESQPFATVQYLVDHLSPGETGCLFGGSYIGNVGISVAGVTVKSLPGQRARVRGYVLVRSSANGVTLQAFDVDGHDVPSVTMQVLGDGVTLRNLDITNRNKVGSSYNGICFAAGYGFERNPANTAVNLTIASSRIHNCGDDGHEHAIYLESTRDAHIVDNYLYDNPGYGLLFYPDAQGTLAEYNVIDGNSGQCRGNLSFSGEVAGGEYQEPHASSKNSVENSLITNSLCRYNVESYYPLGSPTPIGNSVHDSCVWNAPAGNFGSEYTEGGELAYTHENDLDTDPLYFDRAAKDFRLRPGSPCAGKGPRIPPGCVVPRMIGLRVVLARRRIGQSGCSSGRVRYARSRQIGRVVRQTPRPGTTRGFHARVHLVVGRS